MQRPTCADCGEEGGVNLKACKACMLVKYCNANCQRNHWPKHKKQCKLRAAELRDEALFKEPPPKEDCPICFLPMPDKLISCVTLPPATMYSVPIYDYAIANQELAKMVMEEYYTCCGKTICRGCIYSFQKSGNYEHCPYCKAETMSKTNEERVEELMKRVEVNDAGAMTVLGNLYHHGEHGLLQDWRRHMSYGSRPRHLDQVRPIFNWAMITLEREIQRKPSSTSRLQLWQDVNMQETTLDTWSISWEIGNELLNIGQSQHQLGIILSWIPCEMPLKKVWLTDMQSTQL